jgi:hypothetical protein
MALVFASASIWKGYLENFDRLLQQLPADQLWRTFDALGVRIDVRFAPNPDTKSRRQRVPVGGTMIFGAAGIRKGSGNETPPAGAEGDASNDENWLGCGGSYLTQISLIPASLFIVLSGISFSWRK